MKGPWDHSQTWECLGDWWAWGHRDECCGVRTVGEMAERVKWMVGSGWLWSRWRELGSMARTHSVQGC